jgi:malate dehydrogenase
MDQLNQSCANVSKLTPKISLIGAGNIGGFLAYLLLEKKIGNVTLIDRKNDLALGKALDLAQSFCTLSDQAPHIFGTDSLEEIKDSDVIVVTAGLARSGTMTREDLLNTNAKIIKDIGRNIKEYAKNAFVIVVTNPLDAMVWIMKQETGFDAKRIVGMAGVLDSARFIYFLSKALNVATSDIQTTVLGGHGDLMVPLARYTSIKGIPLLDWVAYHNIDHNIIKEAILKTQLGGGDIVKLLQTGSAFFAPSKSILAMIESYLFDQNRILAVTSFLENKYETSNIFAGVPTCINRDGAHVVEIDLDQNEKQLFKKSIESIRKLISEIII